MHEYKIDHNIHIKAKKWDWLYNNWDPKISAGYRSWGSTIPAKQRKKRPQRRNGLWQVSWPIQAHPSLNFNGLPKKLQFWSIYVYLYIYWYRLCRCDVVFWIYVQHQSIQGVPTIYVNESMPYGQDNADTLQPSIPSEHWDKSETNEKNLA